MTFLVPHFLDVEHKVSIQNADQAVEILKYNADQGQIWPGNKQMKTCVRFNEGKKRPIIIIVKL